MAMKIVICDDREFELEILRNMCEKYAAENSLEAEIVCTADAAHIETEQPDILILDIDMPQKSGIEVKNELAKGDRPLIIFATAYFEFIKEAFGRNVIGYMQKPVKKYEFDKYMKTAIDIISLETIVYIDDTAAVKSSDIIMINSDRGYTEIELVSGSKKTGIRKSLKAWEEELGQYGFMRINDSCLINCGYVRAIEGNFAIVRNTGVKLKISRRRKAECAGFFRDYSIKSSRYIFREVPYGSIYVWNTDTAAAFQRSARIQRA